MSLKNISEILYPRRCPLCDGLLSKQEPFICKFCSKSIQFVQAPLCLHCGRPVVNHEKELCAVCRRREMSFRESFAPFLYTGQMQSSMMRFKYGNRAEYARFYAQAICSFGSHMLRRWEPECLLPVPIHRSRMAMRGYNQAEELAVAIGKQLQIPVDTQALHRGKKTTAQKGLSGRERRANLKSAFSLAPDAQLPRRLLLVDDIYTTGSTLDALAQTVLHKFPDAEIYAVCACIAAGRS